MICRATLEYDEETPIPTREYILQNWRADVVALTSSTGDLLERITYDARPLSEGGIAFATHSTDLRTPAKGGATSATAGYGTPSGVVNNDDYLYFLTLYGLGDWRADWNRDGVVDIDDHTAFYTQWAAATGSWGRGVLSNRGNILGYAGYVHEPATGAAGGGHGTMWHVRHRVLHSGLGRWVQRDPIEYPEGPNLYWYGASNPVVMLDWTGLACGTVDSACGSIPGGWIAGPVLPYPGPQIPCNHPTRKTLCDRWARQSCASRAGALTPGCWTECITAASECCSRSGCNAPGMSQTCVGEGIAAMAWCNQRPGRQACFRDCMQASVAPGGVCAFVWSMCNTNIAWQPIFLCFTGCTLMLIPGIPPSLQLPYRTCVIGCAAGIAWNNLIFCPMATGCLLSEALWCADICGY